METLSEDEETSVSFQTNLCKVILDLKTHFCGVLPYLMHVGISERRGPGTSVYYNVLAKHRRSNGDVENTIHDIPLPHLSIFKSCCDVVENETRMSRTVISGSLAGKGRFY